MTNTESTQPQDESAENAPADSRLIRLQANSEQVGRTHDINSKIDMLDGSLGELNAELESIRASVEQGLDRLSDTDMDLTAKVSDTYKRLGELDNTYKALTEISRNIDSEIKKLTGDISQVASQSSAELEKLEATAEVHNSYLTSQHEALSQRVEKLVEDSHATSTRLQLGIRDVQQEILLAEQKLIAEIDSLAASTQQQDEILAKSIDSANIEIESGKARMLKLQKVDEALEKRAQQLQQTTQGLEKQADNMSRSINVLDSRTMELTNNVSKLQQHTQALQRESEHQASMIVSAQQNLKQIAHNLFELGGTERRHFRLTVSALLILVLAVGGIYMHQRNENRLFSDVIEQQAQSVDREIHQLSSNLDGLENNIELDLVVLDNRLSRQVETLSNKLASVDSRVQQLDEQSQSLEGRISAAGIDDGFGGDNILHGPQWLARLPGNQYLIRLATVDNKQQLFELAQRYGDYLKQPVAYYSSRDGRHVMLTGAYDSDRIALHAAQNLPYRINWQLPQVVSVSSVQQAL